MWTHRYFIRFIELPMAVEGVTIPNDDGTFDIYINDLLDDIVKERKIAHEVHHIKNGDFYNDIAPVGSIEEKARIVG